MADFSHLLNWSLRYGSHDFPGPDGGTCINEAAVVAAGFPYRTVRSLADLPPCFCPVVGEVSVWLNDRIPDSRLRTRLLLPFVMRLAGTRGGPEDERRRLEVLRVRLFALTPARLRRRSFAPSHKDHLLLGPLLGPMTDRRFTLRSARTAKDLLRIADAVARGLSAAELLRFFEGMSAALDAMLRVGPQTSGLDADLVFARMEAVKAEAGLRTLRASGA